MIEFWRYMEYRANPPSPYSPLHAVLIRDRLRNREHTFRWLQNPSEIKKLRERAVANPS